MRRFVVGLSVVVGLVCGTSNAFAQAKPKSNVRPNVVIIYADDLGWGDLGCYGNKKFKTPRLDNMAAEGARLTNFYSVCPYCAPSRYGLLTGRYPNRGDMTNNPTPDAGPKYDELGIRDDERTLGEMLQAVGYKTACVGKWHLGHKPQFLPVRHGFDEYFGILYSNDMRPVQLVDGEKVVEYPVDQNTLTKRYTERCLEFLERNRSEPFFLYVPQVMVHKPLAASPEFYKKTGTGLYGDALAELDWSVGQILDKLDALGLSENTYVFFSSDNGPWFGGSSGGLRGMKAQGFEGGIRVPLLARRPGTIPPGRVCDGAAAIIDLFPTVLKAAGVPIPKDLTIDGRDLSPLLAHTSESMHEHLFTLTSNGVITVRRGPWKLHVGTKYGRVQMPSDGSRWKDPRGPDGTTIFAPDEQPQPSELPFVDQGDPIDGPTLFNLLDDPREQRNVAKQHPEVVRDLLARVEKFNSTTPQPKPQPPRDREAIKAAAQAGAGQAAVVQVAVAQAAATQSASPSIVVHKRGRPEAADGKFSVKTSEETWKPAETVVIVCDMWDAHHCLNAVRRAEEMAPRMDAFLKEARSRGTFIIHAPSSCMEAYADTPGRALALAAPKAANLPQDIDKWCRHLPSEDRGEYPIDQTQGGEDDDPEEHAKWHEKLAAMGRNPKAPWKRQMDALTIAPGDAISDSGIEIWNLLEARGVKNVILLGVHTNMCVAGRPFGLRQMSKNGKNTVLVRDLTDTMYDPTKRPFVSHYTGTDLIVEHIEKFICPTITSVDLLGGKRFHFAADKRTERDE